MDRFIKRAVYVCNNLIQKIMSIFHPLNKHYVLAISSLLMGNLDMLRPILQREDVEDIRDDAGNTLLHMSIFFEKRAIFDHIVSLGTFDLETKNAIGESALMFALSLNYPHTMYFALQLVKNGANVLSVSYHNNMILHFALYRRYIELAELAIQRGAALDTQNDTGSTPLHMLFHNKTKTEGVNEGVALMLCNDADVTVVDCNGYTPFDLAILYGPDIAPAHEYLFYYTFDSFTNCEMQAEVFLALVELGPAWFHEIVDKITVVFDHYDVFHSLLLFAIKPEILKSTIEHFEHVVVRLLTSQEPVSSCTCIINTCVIENFNILLNSALRDETLNFIGRIEISSLVPKLLADKIPNDVVYDLIAYLLTYGLQVWEYDLEVVYKAYGFCEVFKTMLYMDVKKDRTKRIDIMPKIIFDLNMDVKEFIGHYFTHSALDEMLCYFSQSDLRNLCCWSNKELAERVTSLPQVPLLIELARDAARKFLLKKYSVTRITDFFTLLKKLPITRTHEAILTYETKLY